MAKSNSNSGVLEEEDLRTIAALLQKSALDLLTNKTQKKKSLRSGLEEKEIFEKQQEKIYGQGGCHKIFSKTTIQNCRGCEFREILKNYC